MLLDRQWQVNEKVTQRIQSTARRLSRGFIYQIYQFELGNNQESWFYQERQKILLSQVVVGPGAARTPEILGARVYREMRDSMFQRMQCEIRTGAHGIIAQVSYRSPSNMRQQDVLLTSDLLKQRFRFRDLSEILLESRKCFVAQGSEACIQFSEYEFL